MSINSGNAGNVDRRILRTRKLLREALLNLLDTKIFDEITVQDIAEQAEINRATFYLHYADKHDLMVQIMNQIFDELSILPTPYGDSPDTPDLDRLCLFFLKVFEHVAQYAKFYRIMLLQDSVASYAMRMQDYVEQIGLRWFSRAKVDNPAVPIEVIMSMVGGAFIGLVRWWLKNDMNLTPEQVSSQFMEILLPGILSAIGK